MKHIRTSKLTKIIACYLAIQLVLTTIQPLQLFALTGGPSQPEFNSFTPIGTSDMVNLSSGDFNYNIPIMDVGGYPLNLAYDSGITMDQEASWVGLGWNLNVGQISRNVRGIPDDFKGDQMIYENNLKENVTIGASTNVFASGFGVGEDLSLNAGFGLKYNNYNGFGFSLTGGLSYQVSENLSVGMNMSASASEGTSVSPSVSLSNKKKGVANQDNVITGSLGTTLNSRQGITDLTVNVTRRKNDNQASKYIISDKENPSSKIGYSSGSIGSYISFADASYTPTKSVGMVSSNYTFSLNLEGELWGLEPGVKFTGYRTSQGIRDSEKYKLENAFGFDNTYAASTSDVLDFNREKDRTFNQYSTTLPITNNTYDLYSIQGQGISGMFRPYKSQVGHVYDNKTTDISHGGRLSGEVGAGGGVHWGFDGEVLPSKGQTRRWEERNNVLPKFKESVANEKPGYEHVFFKNIGGLHVDQELELLETNLGGYHPIKPALAGGRFARTIEPFFRQKKYNNNGVYEPGNYNTIPVNDKIKRTKRLKRNQSIQKLTRIEATKYGFDTQFSPYSLAGKHDHHTSEVRILKNDGASYIYGLTAYNVVKKEVTFDISGKQGDCKTGLVTYTPNSDNTASNNRSGDQYFNRVTTPSYAHTYLLTSVLSSDYEDLTNNGPTDDDLGGYTKFTYENKNNELYKWRIPYDKNKANYNQGIISSEKDDKGNYIYGEKELVYIKEIETKTHIATFHLSERKDAIGVDDENGGGSVQNSKMWKLDRIALYAKPEYQEFGDDAEPIKEAHFVYDYSLCKNVKNNFGGVTNELSNDKGKLSLQKVYFTYRNSNMGAYTPYTFDYSDFNPNYDSKASNIWGNYKPNTTNSGCNLDSNLTNAEFAYVDQTDANQADLYTSAWSLQSINLPSGGRIEMEYESDEYRYVQNKKAMQMFKVIGAGSTALAATNSAQLFNSDNDLLYKPGAAISNLYIELDESITNNPEIVNKQAYFKDKYIKDLIGEAVYFRFLLNMTKDGGKTSGREDDDFDFVTGYFQLEETSQFGLFETNGTQYASIPVELVSGGKGVLGGKVNPIVKAGWHYGRKYLNKKVYSINDGGDEDVDDLKGVVLEIIGAIPAIFDIFSSPNGKLQQRRIARRFIKDKSWIRLMNPNERKLGGGHRVKTIKMHDEWDTMTTNDGNPLYKQFYGQEYTYDSADGKSSGVATYEPLGSKENPLVQPFYDKRNPGLLLGPDESNYVEKPLGESFFPSPTVTYGRVKVKNLTRERVETDGNGNNTILKVKKHATGAVVTEFYTSLDYPTITDYTSISSAYDKSDVLSGLLKLRVREHLTLSQGYSIHTNDMNGKMKSQRIYAEGQTQFISGVDYKYDQLPTQGDTNNYNPNQGKLNNVITTIDAQGTIEDKLVGVDYDVINDFRDSKTVSETYGVKFNTAGIPITVVIVVVPVPLPKYSRHETQIKTAVTTKVIHSTGILREKVAYDVGSQVSTKNLAWDAATGEVLLTETINEYKDKYYTFNYPAYWAYAGMDQAVRNLDLEWNLETTGSNQYHLSGTSITASDYLIEGDELWVETASSGFKAWVVDLQNSNFTLINEDGLRYTSEDFSSASFKIIRSGYRNLQSTSMASVTSMINPIVGVSSIDNSTFYQNSWDQYRIVNASAIQYDNTWEAQCECDLPKMEYDTAGNLIFDYDTAYKAYNPYKYNIKGDWRAKKSFAYLTGRNFTNDPTPRKDGFFKNFRPLYSYSNSTWELDTDLIAENGSQDNDMKWTFASQVNQYSPYGMEIENKDALDRYSSSQYGYNYKLPVAVASNTKYKELGYDGFEDYNFRENDSTAHFSFQKNTKETTISISTQESHTGRSSLKIAPNSSAIMSQQIISCDDITETNTNRSAIQSQSSKLN